MSWYAADKMYHFIYCLPIGLSVVLLALTLYLWAAARTRLCGGGKRRIWQTACALLLLVWIFGTVQTTLLSRTETERELLLRPLSHLSAVLLHGGERELLRADWMNLLLFVPCGLALPELLPQHWGRWRILLTAAAALLLSMGIEWMQYTCRLGAAETDDVLFNTLGALTGMLQQCDFSLLRSCRGKAQTGTEQAEN